ncbi:hypothetical protein HDU98_005847 [Podochytrium sp. JEL0797]|nr:hypothetical protein HDU98_005847 [Podochytrium sp. JEL0797]
MIPQALRSNAYLEVLNLEGNSFNDDVMNEFARALTVNATLTELRFDTVLSSSSVETEQAFTIAMESNHTLKTLTLAIQDVPSRVSIDQALARNNTPAALGTVACESEYVESTTTTTVEETVELLPADYAGSLGVVTIVEEVVVVETTGVVSEIPVEFGVGVTEVRVVEVVTVETFIASDSEAEGLVNVEDVVVVETSVAPTEEVSRDVALVLTESKDAVADASSGSVDAVKDGAAVLIEEKSEVSSSEVPVSDVEGVSEVLEETVIIETTEVVSESAVLNEIGESAVPDIAEVDVEEFTTIETLLVSEVGVSESNIATEKAPAFDHDAIWIHSETVVTVVETTPREDVLAALVVSDSTVTKVVCNDPEVVELNLKDCVILIRDQGVALARGIAENTFLKSLNLSSTDMSNATGMALAQV